MSFRYGENTYLKAVQAYNEKRKKARNIDDILAFKIIGCIHDCYQKYGLHEERLYYLNRMTPEDFLILLMGVHERFSLSSLNKVLRQWYVEIDLDRIELSIRRYTGYRPKTYISVVPVEVVSYESDARCQCPQCVREMLVSRAEGAVKSAKEFITSNLGASLINHKKNVKEKEKITSCLSFVKLDKLNKFNALQLNNICGRSAVSYSEFYRKFKGSQYYALKDRPQVIMSSKTKIKNPEKEVRKINRDLFLSPSEKANNRIKEEFIKKLKEEGLL